MEPDNFLKQRILKAQRNEITEHVIYEKLAGYIKNKTNRDILKKISQDELRHFEFFKAFTKEDVCPDRIKIFIYVFISRIFGLTFGIKLMERGEDLAQNSYQQFKKHIPDIENIIQDEDKHENYLIGLLDEERLKYISSVVLGLNDALVELTGVLAGLTLALQNTRLIAIVGFITGIAASMSMAASEYLSTKQEDTGKNPLKASVYTGIAYVATVIFLIVPYFVFKNIFAALGFVVTNALLIVLLFTFYISVAKDLSFKKRFFEMAALSVSIALINFFIGLLIRKFFGIDI
ncbi:MAG: VIT1/CCC1 transporter family protein [Candidatus Omnitrophica bacterium]|nr:VIT1/CCC1 transporter family protein [Candidatus Omnitrophota bacterium]